MHFVVISFLMLATHYENHDMIYQFFERQGIMRL